MLSSELDTTSLPEEERAQHVTIFSCPLKSDNTIPVEESHSCIFGLQSVSNIREATGSTYKEFRDSNYMYMYVGFCTLAMVNVYYSTNFGTKYLDRTG